MFKKFLSLLILTTSLSTYGSEESRSTTPRPQGPCTYPRITVFNIQRKKQPKPSQIKGIRETNQHDIFIPDDASIAETARELAKILNLPTNPKN